MTQGTTQLAEAAELSGWIFNQLPTSFVSSGTNQFALAWYSLALHHREAIICLLDQGEHLRGSAFALLRPVMEAYIRGMWGQYCLTEAQAADIHATSIIKVGLDSMVKAIDKAALGPGTLMSAKQRVWGELSDFTHGGPAQVSRWFGVDGIEPTYTERDVARLLFSANLYGLLSAIGWAEICGSDIGPLVDRTSALVEAEVRASTLASGESGATHKPQ